MQDRPLGLPPHLNANPWGFYPSQCQFTWGFYLVSMPAKHGVSASFQFQPWEALPRLNASPWGSCLITMPAHLGILPRPKAAPRRFYLITMPAHLGLLPHHNAGSPEASTSSQCRLTWGFRLVSMPAKHGASTSPQSQPLGILPRLYAGQAWGFRLVPRLPLVASTPPQSPASPTPLKSPDFHTALPTRRRTPRISPARRPPAVQGRPGQTPRSGAH